MTMKFMEEGLRFGRTWVDRIMGKVDKDQGVANAGKVLGIGDDGQVVPVEQSGGNTTPTTVMYSAGEIYTAIANGTVKVGDIVYGDIQFYGTIAVATNVVNIGTGEAPLLRIRYQGISNKTSVTRRISAEITKITESNGEYELEIIPCTIEGSTKGNGSFQFNNAYESYEDLNTVIRTITKFKSTTSTFYYSYVGQSTHTILATDHILSETINSSITLGGYGNSLTTIYVVHK